MNAGQRNCSRIRQTGPPARPVWTEGGSWTRRRVGAGADADPSVAGLGVWNSTNTAAGVRSSAGDQTSAQSCGTGQRRKSPFPKLHRAWLRSGAQGHEPGGDLSGGLVSTGGGSWRVHSMFTWKGGRHSALLVPLWMAGGGGCTTLSRDSFERLRRPPRGCLKVVRI